MFSFKLICLHIFFIYKIWKTNQLKTIINKLLTLLLDLKFNYNYRSTEKYYNSMTINYFKYIIKVYNVCYLSLKDIVI